jgi:hypothetical protein
VDSLQVLREVIQPVRTMWLDEEIVIHVEPAEGFMECLVECRFFRAAHEEVGDNKKQM